MMSMMNKGGKEMNNATDKIKKMMNAVKNGQYTTDDGSLRLKLSEITASEARVFLPGDLKTINNELNSFHRLVESGVCYVECENTDAFSLAKKYVDESGAIPDDPKVLVLNAANPVMPGGGVRRGETESEEILCRQSTLLLSLESKDAWKYYDYNRRTYNDWGSDTMIVSPYVEVFKDCQNEFVDDTFVVSVLSCAAPMLFWGINDVQVKDYYDLVYQRMISMLNCAATLGYEYLVLGAWGCDAYYNDAVDISTLFHRAIRGFNYYGNGAGSVFRKIGFAVLDRSRDMYNYKAFSRLFSGHLEVMR